MIVPNTNIYKTVLYGSLLHDSNKMNKRSGHFKHCTAIERFFITRSPTWRNILGGMGPRNVTLRHRPCKNGWTYRAAVWDGEWVGPPWLLYSAVDGLKNCVLDVDRRACWRHLANTVEWLCAVDMSESATRVATPPVPKSLWAILILMSVDHGVYLQFEITCFIYLQQMIARRMSSRIIINSQDQQYRTTGTA